MNIDTNSLSVIFDEMPDPAFFHDDQFRLLKANKAYFDLAGVVSGEVIGLPYYDVFPRANGPLPQCCATLNDPESQHSREEFIFDEKTFTSFSYLHRDHNKKPLYAFHVLTDITNQKHIENKFQKIASQFSVLFELSPDAIMLLDDQNFFDCNTSTLRIFGCEKREEFIGKHPSQFSPAFQSNGKSSRELANKHIAEAYQRGSSLFEWTHTKLDGTEFPTEVLLVAFPRDNETVLQATVRDISERKQVENQLAVASDDLNDALTSIISTMSKTMELRDSYTSGHQVRVAAISVLIAKQLNWDAKKIRGLEMAALLHDIGKIAIPSEILTKPSEPTKFELGLIREHPFHGYQILKDIKFPWPIADMVYQHHERLDGSGYPLNLKGDQILEESRLLGIADTIEAMSTNRPYRFALGLTGAIEELKLGRNKKYDPQIVDAALVLFEGKSSLDEVIKA